MKKTVWFFLLTVCAFVHAELIWTSDFKDNASLKLANGARILEDGVLDCGFEDASSEAFASVDLPSTDLRAGAISFRFRPAYDLMKKAATAKEREMRSILFIPTEGSIYTGIIVNWYNTYGAWLHFYVCSGNDDSKNLQAGLHESNQTLKNFNTRSGEWKNIHVSWTQTSAKMWVDGILAGECSIPEAKVTGQILGQMHFGAATVRNLKQANGNMQIADIKLWNTAETPDSVSEKTKTIAVGGPGTQLYASLRKHYPAPKFSEAPEINGVLNDHAWTTAPELTGFVKNAVGRQFVNTQSVIKLGWNQDYLFLGGCFLEKHIENLKAAHTDRDSSVYLDDAAEFFLLPDGSNMRQVFQLILNSVGGMYDSKSFDAKWNGNWKGAALKHNDGWSFEIAVPFTDLGIPAENGRTLRFMVGRDRVAGNGIDAISASAEITGGFLSPEEYDYIELRDGKISLPDAEYNLNRYFYEETATVLKQKINDGDKELAWGSRLLEHSTEGKSEKVTELENSIAKFQADMKSVTENKQARALDWAKARTSLETYQGLLDGHAEEMNRLGFSSIRKLPENLAKGITKADGIYYVKNTGAAVVVDASTGMIVGCFDENGRKIASYGFDLYHADEAEASNHSDERMDIVRKASIVGSALIMECHNDDLNIDVTKKYFLPNPDVTNGRIISKELTVSGSPKEKTLLTVISRLHFEDAFRDNAEYHRLIAAGLLGEKRSTFKAKDIKQPISLFYFFNTCTTSMLCAYDRDNRTGLGQYWFKANGEWVLPGGSDTYNTLLNQNGWDLSWFMTFITPKPSTGEMRLHVFDGDRINFHTEYRDAPERLKALDAGPVSPEAEFRRYYLNLSFDVKLLDDPDSMVAQKYPFLYGRMRSNEYSLALDYGNNDKWYGDYPSGDDAILHLDYAPDAKTMTGKQKRDMVNAGRNIFPNILPGWYHTPQNICFHSKLANEHPEFVMMGKDGKPVPSYWNIYHGMGNFSKEFWDNITEKICKQMDYNGERTVYLDYTVMVAQPDWGAGIVRYSADHIYFLKRLYQEVHKRHGVLFNNGVTCDGIYDLTYYEGWQKYQTSATGWRDSADSILMRYLYAPRGVRVIPIYWYGGNHWNESTRNYRDYTNMLLSQLVAPTECWHDPYEVHFKNPETGKTNWINVSAHSVPYFDFSCDLGWTRLAYDIDFEPCWWKDDSTTLENYVFRKSQNCYVVTALRHEPATEPAQDVTVTADFAKMKFQAGKAIFKWQCWPRDPDKFPRNGAPLPENWERLFDKVECSVIDAPQKDGRLDMVLKDVPADLSNLALITQVPAVFTALEGKKLTFCQPEVLGNSLSGTLADGSSSYTLMAETILPAEAMVFLPNGAKSVKINKQPVQFIRVRTGSLEFASITLPKGKSTISVTE